MKKLITALLTVMLLIASIAYAAGSLADANKAYKKGDYTQAIKIYKPLAVKGDAIAQYSLGLMYDKGQGVVKDEVEAVKWYRLAAAQGIADAQAMLGASYFIGKVVVQDYVAAHMWFNLAAAQGVKDGIKYRAQISESMNTTQIELAQKLARECLARNYKDC